MGTELLAPAGTLNNLKWAIAYGADAVYFGLPLFSLRSYAGNFTLEDAHQGLNLLHKKGKKGYATLNCYPFTNEYPTLLEMAKQLADMRVDAFIVADMGVFQMLRRELPEIDIHISTQANTVSLDSALFYRNLGATRVNLARELSFSQIDDITKGTKGKIETEVFIHGAVCFSYSGRCAISDWLTGRRANRGECTQSCRWGYHVVEEKRPGTFIPVSEDERGSYIFNSKDLALYAYVDRLVETGVSSLKIEGRMKNNHYIAAVVGVYRDLLDKKEINKEEIIHRLTRITHRDYCEGFMKGSINSDDYETHESAYHAGSVILAESDETVGQFIVKNSIFAGETLELVTPQGISEYTIPTTLFTNTGREIERAENTDTLLLDLPEYSILRRVKERTI